MPQSMMSWYCHIHARLYTSTPMCRNTCRFETVRTRRIKTINRTDRAEHRAESGEQRSKTGEQRAERREQRADGRERKGEARELIAESRGQARAVREHIQNLKVLRYVLRAQLRLAECRPLRRLLLQPAPAEASANVHLHVRRTSSTHPPAHAPIHQYNPHCKRVQAHPSIHPHYKQ